VHVAFRGAVCAAEYTAGSLHLLELRLHCVLCQGTSAVAAAVRGSWSRLPTVHHLHAESGASGAARVHSGSADTRWLVCEMQVTMQLCQLRMSQL